MTEHIQVVPDKCRACRRCEAACIAAHHGIELKEAMKRREEFVPRVHVYKEETYKTSVRCHQCEHAPCANVCPTGALQQDSGGRITMREEYCVACGMCIAACPYGAIALDNRGKAAVSEGETTPAVPVRTVAVRCDMCRDWRAETGHTFTACMEACPVRCLTMVRSDGSVLEVPAPVKKAVAAKPAGEAAATSPAPAK